MNHTFDSYKADMLRRGFDEVISRDWPAGAVLDTHAHDFALEAVLVSGEMWLTVGDATRHLRPGDPFALDAGVPHAERYGAAGATYWVARRHPA
jgi:mannose-6-phosphate isomerase-like protein (cupin superfamily)